MKDYLDRANYDLSRPMGDRTALGASNAHGVGGTFGSQDRKMASAYGQALRILNRQARRGDAKSALAAISVRGEANANGYSPGGIRDKAQSDYDTMGRLNAHTQAATDMNAAQSARRGQAQQILMGGTAEPGQSTYAQGPPASAVGPSNPYAPPVNRLYAGLDMLEGAQTYGNGGSRDQLAAGYGAAMDLGVEEPNNLFGQNDDLKYRQTLDSALGQAKTPEERAALKQRGVKYGVRAQDFDRRANWWLQKNSPDAP